MAGIGADAPTVGTRRQVLDPLAHEVTPRLGERARYKLKLRRQKA
jgi:hypothetical protein